MRSLSVRGLDDRTLAPGVPWGGLLFWLRAEDVPATPVSLWPDVSGNGNDFVQATSGRQPTLASNVLNGYPSVVFDGSDDSLGSTLNINQPFTWVTVCRITGTTNDRTVIGSQNPANGAQLGAIMRSLNGNLSLFAGSNFNGTAIGSAFRVFGAVFNTTSSVLTADASQTGGGNPGTRGANLITIGAYVQGGAPTFSPWEGDVVEAIGWSRVLTSAELTAVYEYLSAKYAL